MNSTKTILIGAVIIAALILLGNCGGQATTYRTVTYTVQPGDTLWELGGQYAPRADRREWVHNVRKANNIDACLQVGQALKIYEEVNSVTNR